MVVRLVAVDRDAHDAGSEAQLRPLGEQEQLEEVLVARAEGQAHAEVRPAHAQVREPDDVRTVAHEEHRAAAERQLLPVGATGRAVARAQVLADTLDTATGGVLNNDRSPSREVNELDNRGSHFYLALYWAQALAAQTTDADLAATFTPRAEKLAAEEATIVAELNAAQGTPVDFGPYYRPDEAKATARDKGINIPMDEK